MGGLVGWSSVEIQQQWKKVSALFLKDSPWTNGVCTAKLFLFSLLQAVGYKPPWKTSWIAGVFLLQVSLAGQIGLAQWTWNE